MFPQCNSGISGFGWDHSRTPHGILNRIVAFDVAKSWDGTVSSEFQAGDQSTTFFFITGSCHKHRLRGSLCPSWGAMEDASAGCPQPKRLTCAACTENFVV